MTRSVNPPSCYFLLAEPPNTPEVARRAVWRCTSSGSSGNECVAERALPLCRRGGGRGGPPAGNLFICLKITQPENPPSRAAFVNDQAVAFDKWISGAGEVPERGHGKVERGGGASAHKPPPPPPSTPPLSLLKLIWVRLAASFSSSLSLSSSAQ